MGVKVATVLSVLAGVRNGFAATVRLSGESQIYFDGEKVRSQSLSLRRIFHLTDVGLRFWAGGQAHGNML